MFKPLIVSVVCLTFTLSNIQYTQAQPALSVGGDFNINQLPVPGSMISTTLAYVPLTLKGLIIHPENALQFDFLMDTGHSNLKDNELSDEALKIMKYFLTALTIPEDDLWVNLSPYENKRIIQLNFGQTIMGRDLLAQDYVLKQLTASLIYPEKALGKEFWQQVYSKAAKEFGTTQIPVNTFNKVWIVPSEAVVWEHENKILIVKSHLKVMLEEDYLSLSKHAEGADRVSAKNVNKFGSQIVRNIVLPVLEKEVNEGKNFAQLRQMYQAMILATWYKKALRESIITKLYANKKKVAGIGYMNSFSSFGGSEEKGTNDVGYIYQQYLKAFKKGAFNYIKEDLEPATGQTITRKYFSGGFNEDNLPSALRVWGEGTALTNDQAMSVNYALENTGSMILVKGNITELGPKVSAVGVKRLERQVEAQQATMNARMKILYWRLKGTENIGNIFSMLDHRNFGVRLAAMKAIDAMVTDPQQKLAIFKKALNIERENVHLWAITGLGNTGNINTLELLLAVLNASYGHSDGLLTMHFAGSAIGKLNTSLSGSNEGRKALFRIYIAILENSDQDGLISIAAKALGDLGNPQAIEPLLKRSGGYQRTYSEVIKALKKLNASPDQMVHAYTGALLSSDTETVTSAVRALRELDGSKASQKVLYFLQADLNSYYQVKREKQRKMQDTAMLIRTHEQCVNLIIEAADKIAVILYDKKESISRVATEIRTVLVMLTAELEVLINMIMQGGFVLGTTAFLGIYLTNTFSKKKNGSVIMEEGRPAGKSSDQAMLGQPVFQSLSAFLALHADHIKLVAWYHGISTGEKIALWAVGTMMKVGLSGYAVYKKKYIQIAYWTRMGNVKMIKDKLGDNDKSVRQAAQEALIKLGVSEAGIRDGFDPAKDNAALSQDPGGISLDAKMLDLQIKRDGNGVPLPISQQSLGNINIQGFVPQIISIQPVNLLALLGLNSQKVEKSLTKV
jgi:HEAT repeat protein